jgi:hypothetical protein
VIMVNRDTPSREEKRSRPTLVDQLDQLSETEILTAINETLKRRQAKSHRPQEGLPRDNGVPT